MLGRVNYYLFIYLILAMHKPQLNTDEAHPDLTKIEQFMCKVDQYKEVYNQQSLLSLVKQITSILRSINTDHLDNDHCSKLIDKNFEILVNKLDNQTILVKDATDHYKQLVLTILDKLIKVFKVNKRYSITLNVLKSIFKRENSFFYKLKERAGYNFFGAGASRQTNLSSTLSLHICHKFVKLKFLELTKEVWTMQLSDYLGLFELFNEMERSNSNSTEVHQLYQAYFTQIMAYFNSGRPELINYALIDRLYLTGYCLYKSQELPSKKHKYETMIPTLAKTLIIMGDTSRIQGIKLLNSYCKKIFSFDYSQQAQRLKTWLNKNDVFIHILNKQTTQCQYQEAKYILKCFGKSMHGQQKTNNLLRLLRQNNNENKWVGKFCLKQLEVYSMSAEEKMSLVEYLGAREDIALNYPEYQECIDDLVYRLDYYQKLVEPIFNILIKIAREAFDTLSQSYQNKLLSNIRMSSRSLKSFLSKMNHPQKAEYVKKIIASLLLEVTHTSILLFNAIFQQGQLYKAFSNNPFQSIMNYIIDDMQILTKIFEFLEKSGKGQMQAIVKTIHFVTKKSSIKIDVTQKYLKTLAKFPVLYQNLISNQGFQKVKKQMQNIIDIVKQQPDTPFHLLRTTFFKANYKKISQHFKQPSYLVHHQEQPNISYHPNELQWYEQIISLMQQTPNEHLRHDIAEFIISLHINHSNHQFSSDKKALPEYMHSILDYFKENTKSYRNKQASTRSILANLELIQQMMRFTDVLGVGRCRPHNSLVSTATTPLTILNNVTFGDDIRKSVNKNFPSNMILFDLLTQVGLSFKCGPEDLVLKQGDRFIPIIFNGCSIEDLHLTDQDLIAEKNDANLLKAPEVFEKNKTSKQKLNQIYQKCLKQVFDRFAYQGRMSQIQAINYIRQVSGSYVMGYDRRIKQMFQDFDKDKDGILTYDDFVNYNIKNMSGMYENYYRKQFIAGLENLRYRKNMTLYNQPLDISSQEPLMMRFMIEKNSEVYEELFKYAHDQHQDVSKKAKELLLELPTCPAMKGNKPQTFDFSKDSQFLIYYKLIVIEQELSHGNPKLSAEAAQLQKTQKISLFLNNKFNEVIFQTLKIFYAKINENQLTYKSFTICLKILRSLINIENLTKTMISRLNFTPQLIHSLPHSTFFAQEAIKALNTKNIINFEVLLVLQLTQQYIDINPILLGCFNEDKDIRVTCCNFLYLWQEKTHWKDNLFQVTIPQNKCEEWFDLLSIIIARNNSINFKQILANTIDNLQKRQETIYNRDNMLLHCYLKVFNTLLFKYKNLAEETIIKETIPKLLDRTFSQKSRALLYNILTTIDDRYLIEYLGNMLQTVLPSQQCQVRSLYMGLRNMGATCYMNSILQQFFMLQKFRYLILNRKVPTDGLQVQQGGKVIIDDFMYQLQKMYYHLQFSQKKSFMPKQFGFTNKDWDGKPINTSIQEDSHEFLNRMIENIENACKKDDTLRTLQDLCEVRTLTEYECGDCKNRIDKIENHYSCMLEVKEQSTLAGSLKKWTDKEEIQDYTCENCKKKVKSITKRTYLYELPEIVILNLQRIIYDPKKGDKIKVHSKLSFPMELDLQDYVKNQEVKETKYQLKGVVIHTGTSQGGHYYSLIRDNDNSQQKWLKFNDQNVVPFDQKQLQRQGFGGFESKDNDFQDVTYSTNAYILFYQKINIKKMDFCQVENTLSEEVHAQNLKLIKEVQIHQECFFSAINKLYQKYRFKNIGESVKKQNFAENALSEAHKQNYKKMLDIHQKAFSFLSVYNDVSAETRNKITDNMIELYHVLPEETATFLKELNIDTFVQNILGHNNQLFRQTIKLIFLRSLYTFIGYFGVQIDDPDRPESQLLRNILDKLLSQIQGKTLYSNLNKAENYFLLLAELVDNVPSIRSYLLSKHLMFHLLDLIMGKQSSHMKYHPKAQDLPANLVFSIYELLVKIIYSKKNLSGAHSSKKKHAPYLQTTTMQAKIILNPTFYRRIFRLNYDHQFLTILIVHYSYEDLEYSVMICDILLQQINKGDQTNIPLLMKRLTALLTVIDKIKEIRWGCILGFPQNQETKPNHYCLSSNDRSDNIHYSSSAYPNKEEIKKYDNDRKSLLQILFIQRLQNNKNLILCGLHLLLSIAQGYETFFDYIMKIPPPNYYKACIFDLIPNLSGKLYQDFDFITDNKVQKVTEINSLYDIIQERIKVNEKKLPVKPFIIGKTTVINDVDKIKNQDFEIELRSVQTYVLENKPEGLSNKSMDKKFSYDIKGNANLFVDYRSKKDYKPEEEVQVKTTIYCIKGHTKVKLTIKIKDQVNDFCFVLAEGDFNVNFPFTKEGKIADVLELELFKDTVIELSTQQITAVFGVQEQQKMKEQPKEGAPAASSNPIPEDKIECPQCTLLNDLMRQTCQVCDHPLFK